MPYDFRRFTTNGIEQLLVDNNFKIISSKKSGTFFEVIVQLGMMYLHSIFYTKNQYIVNLFINAVLIFPLCMIGIFLSWIFPKREELYFNSIIFAKKL
jgi:hypothetical protein